MESHLVISSDSDRVRLGHCSLYDYVLPGENRYRRRQAVTIRPLSPSKQEKWYISMSGSPSRGTLNALYFKLVDQESRDVGMFSVDVGFDRLYLPWCSIDDDPVVEQHSGSHWNVDGFERSARSVILGDATSTSANGLIDRDQKNLNSGHTVSVVVRRRAHISGDPPISKGKAMTQPLQHFYMYTLHVSIDAERPRMGPHSPQATDRASPSLSIDIPSNRRVSTLNLAGMGSHLSLLENEFSQPRHVGSYESVRSSGRHIANETFLSGDLNTSPTSILQERWEQTPSLPSGPPIIPRSMTWDLAGI